MIGPSGSGHGKLAIPAITAVIDLYIKGRITIDEAKSKIGGATPMGFARLVNARRRELGMSPTNTTYKSIMDRLDTIERRITALETK